MRTRRTRVYRTTGWSHYLDREPRDQGDAALNRKNRRYLQDLDKKIQKAKGKLWAEGNADHLPGAVLISEELADAIAPELAMSVDEYQAALKAIADMKTSDGLADADVTTLFLVDLQKHGVPLLTHEQEVELARHARSGDERAIERLVSANLRLCVYLAKRTKTRGRGKGVAFSDLVSAGVIGLRAALNKFDPERGVRLASFAYSYILGAIRDELEQAQTIRLPREVALRLTHIIATKDQLRAEDYRLTPGGQRVWRGQAPTTEEIAARVGVSPELVDQTLRHPSQRTQPSSGSGHPKAGEEAGLGKTRFDDENTADAWDMGRGSYNYRAEVDGAAFGALEGERAAEHALETSEAYALLYKALETLTKQEREIVSRYFDLVENPEVEKGESLTAIARRLGVSRQRASKLKRRALAKLRKALDDLPD